MYWKGNRKDKEVEVGRYDCREGTREDYGFLYVEMRNGLENEGIIL